ncbi:hypothetical protein HED60_22620 [Planctomycetales bacterium ZRK34]|nr:hypothetical protein HED60_22620 [Planctomycetales bacterium ZRK34]
MFVLTCPSCSREVKTRFARLGATATCPACKAQYKVDEQSLKMEGAAPAGADPEAVAAATSSPAPATPPVESPAPSTPSDDSAPPAQTPAKGADTPAEDELIMSAPKVEELKVKRPPLKKKKPAPEKPIQTKPPAAAESDPSAELAAAVTEPAAKSEHGHKAPDHGVTDTADHKPRRRRKRGIDVKLVAMMLVVLALLIVVVVLVIQRTGKQPTIVINQPQPPTKPEPQPEPQPRPQPRPQPQPVADVPVLELEPPTLVTSNWSRLRTPVDPIVPMSNPDVVLWDAQLMHMGDGKRSMVNGLYVADSPKVYQRGVLRVQLTNDAGMVFAERQMFVPVVCSRDGLQMRVPVPKDLLASGPGLTCEFTPIDPVAGGLALEMVESQVENVGSPESPMYKLAVYNPHAKAVTNPTVVIDAISPEGWPLGSWLGKLQTTIGPGQTLMFQVAPPVDDPTAIGRILVRGFGKRA